MGRDIPLPEDADSWGEYRARLEWEAAHGGGLQSAAWRSVAALLFVAGLLFIGYALTDSRWWMWLCSLAAFAVFFAMAARAKSNLDREGQRAAQLARLDGEWLAHLDRSRRIP